MLIGTRRAFTILELIVVIVILGILALLAIPTFNAVIGRAKDSNVKTAAASFDRNLRALAAFDEAAPNRGEDVITAAGELFDVSMRATAGAGPDGASPAGNTVGETVSTINATVSHVQFTQDDTTVCLTLGTTSGAPGTVVADGCTGFTPVVVGSGSVRRSQYMAEVLALGPSLHWPMDSLTLIQDASPNDRDGAVTMYDAAALVPGVWSDGSLGVTKVAVTGPTDIGSFTAGVTTAFWLRVPTDAATTWTSYAMHAAGKGSAGSPSDTFQAYVFGNRGSNGDHGRVALYGSVNGVWSSLSPGIVVPADGAYHHIVLTYDTATGTGSTYFDGVGTSITGASGALGTNTGISYSQSVFPGMWLDEVTVVARAITAAEVSRLYRAAG